MNKLLANRITRTLFTSLMLLAVLSNSLFAAGSVQTAYAAANDISGRVVKDSEGNASITDTYDTNLQNVHVYLYRDNGDDNPGVGDTLMAETLTSGALAPNDNYSFTGQPNGTYWVVVVSADINSLGSSVEQTYGGVGALVDLDAQTATPATPRATPGAAFGGRRMLVADGFTSDTKLLANAEHVTRVVLDGSGAGHTDLDFGFGFQKGLPSGYAEYYVPTQINGTAGTIYNDDATFGQMNNGIWGILYNLDNNTAINNGMHYIISVGASTDNTKVYYDHWEDGYDFDPLDPDTADVTDTLNKGGVRIYESANIPINRGLGLYFDGRDRIFVAGGLAVVTVSLFPQTPGSVYNVAWEILPVKPLQTNYVVPVGEGMAGNGGTDFSQTFLTIQSTADNNTVTVDDPSEPGVPDLTVVLNRGQVLDVRHTAPGTVVQGTAPIQVHLIGGFYRANDYSEADGITVFPRTLWDDEYYAPVESAGDSNDGTNTLYGTELYLYNPTTNILPLYWEDLNPATGLKRSGTYNLAANSSLTYTTMSGHFVPVGSAAYIKSTNGQKFWAIGQGGVSTNNLNAGAITTGDEHTNYDSGFSLVPGYLLRRDYYLAWAPGNSTADPSGTNASALYVTAVEDGTEIFVDFNQDGVADATDFDNADGNNNPANGTETSYILNRLESIYLQDPSNPYSLSGAHVWSNGATAAVWAPYPRTATNTTPSLDAAYSALPIPLEWMDAALGVLKSVDAPTHKPVVGQQATFTLAIPAYLGVNDVIATDKLPVGWNYSTGTSNVSVTKGGVTTSTTTDPGTTGDGLTVGTREELTWNLDTLFPGLDLEDLDPNDVIVIRFTAVTNSAVKTGYNQNDTEVCGTRTLGTPPLVQTFCAEDKLAVYVVPLSIDKDTTTPNINADAAATYTIRLKNTHTDNIDLTGLSVTDNLPSGFTYVGGSESYTLTEGAGGTAGDSSRPATVNPANGATSLTWGTWTLGEQDELLITFQADTSATIPAGTYDNTATAQATSGATPFTVTDIGTSSDDLGTPLAQDPEPDEDVTIGLTLSGKAWLDDGAVGGTAGDGIRNGTEAGQPGMVVYLYDSTGTYLQQTDLTDASGDYSFGGLASNTTYIVEFGAPPTGYSTTLQDQGGNNTIDSDVVPATRRVSVPLVAASVANVDAGFVPRASIGDRIWLDDDGDGAQDVTEIGIAGVRVFVDINTNGVYDAGTDLLDTTDANGQYLFENLAAGTYRVIVTAADLPGMTQTGDPDATLNNEHTLTVTAPGVYLDVDFGYRSRGLDITKTSNIPGNVDPGNPIQYTINVANNTAVRQTGIAVTDLLPLGTTYVAQSTSVNGYVPVVDLFPTLGSGTTGSGWIGNWLEVTGENDGFGAGNIQVLANGLRIQNGARGAYRQVNLSGYPTAAGSTWLSLTYTNAGLANADDDAYIQISTDGCATFPTTLHTWNGVLADGSGALSYDISSYVDVDTCIRFIGAAGLDAGDSVIVDNVFIGQRIAEDAFPTAGSGTTGTGWADQWRGIGEDDNFGTGDVQVLVPGGLRVRDNDNGGEGAYREVNLSSYASAWLNLTYANFGLNNANEDVTLDVSTNGGTNWNTLYTWNGAIADGSGALSIDISSYIDNDNRIRFLTSANMEGDSGVTVDDVRITGTPSITRDNNSSTNAPALTSGVPSTLVQDVGDGFVLGAGQSMSVTYNVTVDNPVALSNIDNTASVVSTQQTTPRYASVSDPVNLRGSIGDRVWLDEDSDGVQDAGESGISNVTVELRDGSCTSGSTCRTTVTDSEGNYLFSGVTPGNYTVAVISGLPAGLSANPTYDENGIGTPNVSAVTLTAGQEYVTADFGYNWAATTDVTNPAAGATGAIGDRVWIDANGNSVQDPGEPGMGGVNVDLITAGPDGIFGTGDDIEFATATTDASGAYIFDGLAAGAYVVRVDGLNNDTVSAPANYTQTGDPDTTVDNVTTAPIVLAPGDVYVNADFGYRPNSSTYGASIGDTVWLDIDRDGLDDGAVNEPRLPGVSVALIRDTNGNGVWDATEPIIASDVTDDNGQYLFSGVPVDASGTYDYLVWVNDTANVLQGLTASYDFDGAAAPASGLVTGLGISAVTNFSASLLDRDFGYIPVGHAVDADTDDALIGDTIYLDRDGGNDYDAGEGIEGVTVELYRDTDGDGVYDTGEPRVASVETNENGKYFFADLPAGNYVVKVDTSTLPAGVTNTVDPDGGIASQSAVTGLTASQVNLAQDFGYRDSTSPNTIGGSIWRDTNTDGTLDVDGADDISSTPDDEPGIAGVTVTLYDNDGNLVATTTTDSNGYYTFTNLPDGTYRVDVTDNANLINGYWHSNGSNPGANNNSQVDPYTVTVGGGQTNNTADFGYYRNPAAIGDFVWKDVNGDGIQDTDGIDNIPGNADDETGISGVTVTLTIDWPTSSGTSFTTLTTLTDASGFYSFGNLLLDENHDGAGAVGEPTFSISVATPSGYAATTANAGSDDALDSDGTTISAFPVEGLTNNTYDSGFTQLGSITGIVQKDDDHNGTGDTFFGGVTLSLWTDPNGDGSPADGALVTFDVDPGTPGTQSSVTSSAVDGTYTFANVPPGSYIVVETQPAGYVTVSQSDTVADVPVNPADAATTTDYIPVNLAIGETDSGNRFIEEQLSQLSGYTYDDVNANGSYDSGTDTPLTGVTVFLDTNNDGNWQAGEPTTTSDGTTGFYSFTNLPAGTYHIVETNPSGYISTGDKDGAANSLDKIDVILAAGENNTGNNFLDARGNFGHLPVGGTPSYASNLIAGSGAGHLTGTTYLGATVPIESNGTNAATFTMDKTYDDGVKPTPSITWKAGVNGGSMDVTAVCASQPCYLEGWIDWNGDGDFNDANEHVISQALTTTGSHQYTITFNVPTTSDFPTFPASGNVISGTFNSRFRVYAESPDTASPNGQALNSSGTRPTVGEVEDYQWTVTNGNPVSTPVTLSYFHAQRQGRNVYFDWSTATETGNVGFNLYAVSGNKKTLINTQLIPSKVIDSLDRQDYTFSVAATGNTYYIEDVSVLGETEMHGPFQIGQEYGGKLVTEKTNLAAIEAEHENKEAQRQNELEKNMTVPSAALAAQQQSDQTDKPSVAPTPMRKSGDSASKPTNTPTSINFSGLRVSVNTYTAQGKININTSAILLGRIDTAEKSLGSGKPEIAINQMKSFVNTVSAQRGKKIAISAADNLIAKAQAIITLLKSVPTPTPTATATLEPTATPTFTFEPTATSTFTFEPTVTYTYTAEPTATATDIVDPTQTPTGTLEPTATFTDTVEPTATPTHTSEPTATPTYTVEPTATPTFTFEPTATHTNTAEPTATATNTSEPTATATVVPTPPTTAVPYDPSTMKLATTFNFKVNKTGVYRVTYEMLQTAGLDLAGVPAASITVLNRNLMIPVYVYTVDPAGNFGPGGYIEFYGEALDTLYTDTNIYTVQVSSALTSRVVITSGLAQPGLTPAVSYPAALVNNTQRSYATSALGTDPWIDTSMLVTTTAKTWSFNFQINSLVPSSSEILDLTFWGMTASPVNPDHHMQVKLNGVLITDETFDGIVQKTLKIALPVGVLHEGANTLQLTLPADLGVANDLIMLDKFRVNYQRAFIAQNGSLTFTAAGDAFSVANLNAADVIVYRMRAGDLQRLENVNVKLDGTTYTATFAGTTSADTYFVATTTALNVPTLEAMRAKVDLNHPAQYLIIAHPDFINGLQPLVAARQAQGLTVSVVDVTDLYTQYSYGVFDPLAIKQYIAYAARNLGTQYVLLVGGDTYDYRNYLSKNSISFIPSLYTATSSLVNFIPADPLYADVNGDNLPDLAIGRFPARTSAELTMMVGKTLAYDGKSYGFTSAFTSDLKSGTVSFKDISNGMSTKLPLQWSVQNIHLDDLGAPTAKTQLLAAMNRGTALVNFTGHSGPASWTFNNLFNTTDASALTNAGKPFVAVQWGCWNTYYVNPFSTYLVQSLLFSGDKGAAAVFGATSLASSESEQMLGELLIPRLVTPGVTLGQALQDAKHELAQTHPELADVLLGWSLMGDPALVIVP